MSPRPFLTKTACCEDLEGCVLPDPTCPKGPHRPYRWAAGGQVPEALSERRFRTGEGREKARVPRRLPGFLPARPGWPVAASLPVSSRAPAGSTENKLQTES